jgi:hypothetical protein
MVALGAVMHKVCNIIFAVLRDNKPFTIITLEQHMQNYASINNVVLKNNYTNSDQTSTRLRNPTDARWSLLASSETLHIIQVANS